MKLADSLSPVIILGSLLENCNGIVTCCVVLLPCNLILYFILKSSFGFESYEKLANSPLQAKLDKLGGENATSLAQCLY